MKRTLFGGIVVSMCVGANAADIQLRRDFRLCASQGSARFEDLSDNQTGHAAPPVPFEQWSGRAESNASIGLATADGLAVESSRATTRLIQGSGFSSAACHSDRSMASAFGLGSSLTLFTINVEERTRFRLDAGLNARGDGARGSVRVEIDDVPQFEWTTTDGELIVHEVVEFGPGEYKVSLGASTNVTLSFELGQLSGAANYDALLQVLPDCAADIDDSGELDASDFFAYLDLFTSEDLLADFTLDGVIDAEDFFAYLDAFAAGC